MAAQLPQKAYKSNNQNDELTAHVNLKTHTHEWMHRSVGRECRKGELRGNKQFIISAPLPIREGRRGQGAGILWVHFGRFIIFNGKEN